LSVFARLRRDNRGISAISYIFILPLFILVVFGIFEMYKVVAVRQSFHLGVYKAAHTLSWEGPSYPLSHAHRWEAAAAGRAKGIIATELVANPLFPPGHTAESLQRSSILRVQVLIEPGRRGSVGDMGWLFTVRAEVAIPRLTGLLNPGPLTFTERQASYIQHGTGPWVPWEELPEPDPW
jgi:hypothetical protein